MSEVEQVPITSSAPRAARTQRDGFRWDRLTALMATVVAVCALAVSFYTARLQNAQVKATTWPYLQLWKDDSARTFSISNRGVGPAQIRDAKMRVDGIEVDSFNVAFERLAGRPLDCAKTSYFARRVLAANEDVTMISLCNEDDYAVFARAGARLTREVCFCSLLDDCWRIDEANPNENAYLTAVDACPVGTAGVFR